MRNESEIYDEISALLGSVTLDQAQSRIKEIDLLIQELKIEQGKLKALVGIRQQLFPSDSKGRGVRDPLQPTIRQGILMILRQQPAGEELPLHMIVDEFLKRGWMTDREKASHRIQMTASKMLKSRELDRPDRGIYRLPPGDGLTEEWDLRV